MESVLCVRVDYYADGTMIPISFISNNSGTKYIRKVKQIWHDISADTNRVIGYSCLLRDGSTVALLYKNARWSISTLH